ncbi:MAG: glycosyltransferase family 4 protein [bacterium]
MKKILLFTIDFAPRSGGVAKYYENICANLPSDKIIALAGHETGEKKFDDEQNYKIYRRNLISDLPIWPKWIFSFFYLHNAVKREKAELILVGNILPLGIVAWIYKKLFKTPYGLFIHGMDLEMTRQKKRKYKLARIILNNADFIITNSEYTKKLVFNFGINGDKIYVVYPCVDAALNKEVKNNFAAETRLIVLPKDKKMILTLGRVVKRKGHDMVIKALPEVIKKIPDIIYVIAGDGVDKNYLENLSKKCNVKDFVIFTGEVKEANKAFYYKNCDIFIMPARNIAGDVEGFGIVYLEAALFGKPIIAGNIGGAPEAVQDGETGILVNPESEKEISDAIIKLLSDSDLANKFGVQGRERVFRDFTWKKQIEKIKRLLQ